jgi:hypothetical protein
MYKAALGRLSGGLIVAVLVSSQIFATATPLSDQQALARASRNGLYLDGMVDYSNSAWDSGGSANAASWNFSGALGYQYNSMFAGEAGYWYFPSITDVTKAKGGTGTLNTDVFLFNAKVIHAIKSNIDLYVKGGFGFRQIDFDGDTHDFEPYFAFGSDYILNSNISFNAQFNYLSGNSSLNKAGLQSVPSYMGISLGVSYNFMG